MTYKHIKFQDSPVMRSLEKVAVKKGLVKEEELVKKASVKKEIDLSPGPNLLDNLLRLSAGLRAAGLAKYADELEIKTMAYKRAQTLYETSKEEGKDLVDAAHPDGSHKLEDVDGDSVFETIFDQHLKDMEVVEKNPTGKFASSNDIINSVGHVLGASFLDQKAKLSLAQDSASKGGDSGFTTGVVSTVGAGLGIKALQMIYSKLISDPSIDKQFLKELSRAYGRKLTSAESKYWSERLLKEVGEKKLKELLGEKVTQQISQSAFSELEQAAGRSALNEAAKNVATEEVKAVTKSPGAWSRLVQFLRMPVGEAGVGVGVGATAATAAVTFVVAAGATYLATTAIYDNKFYSTELKEAGDKLLSELKDVQKIPGWESNSSKEILFKTSLTACLTAAEKCNRYVSNPTKDGLEALVSYASNLQDASYYAYSLSSAARAIFDDEKMKPGESRDASGVMKGIWDSIRTAPIARVFTNSPQLGDVIITGAEFSNLAQKVISEVNFAIRKIDEMIAKEEAEKKFKQTADAGGAEIQSLINSYTEYLGKINEYIQKVEYRKLPNAKELLVWLNKAKNKINSEKQKFEAKETNKPALVKDYANEFEKIKTYIKQFADKWMV